MARMRRVLGWTLVAVSVLPIHTLPARATARTTIAFSLAGGGSNGTIGLDAIFANGGGGGAYDSMVRWDANNQLWNYDQTLGSPTYGWRTSATSTMSVTGSATVMRLELYPHPTTTCSGTDENQPCYWLTYDPWTNTRGGTHVQVDSTMGPDWLDVGTIRFPTLGDGAAFRADGSIISSASIPDGRVEIDFFQIDCGWHQVCEHPPSNERGVSLGAFGTSVNKGARWTAGIIWPGQYLVNVRDTTRGIELQGMIQMSASRIPTIDLDSPCFGLDYCVGQRGSVPPVAGGFHPVAPTRILDTRKGIGVPNGKIRFGDGSQTSTNPLIRADDALNHDLPILGVAGIPESGVSAVLLNVTAIDPDTDGYITVGPRPVGSGDILNDQNSYGAWPNASNLNLSVGRTAPNLVLVRVGAGGRIRLYNYGYPLHMVADVAGWFDTGSTTSTGGLGLTGLNPTRILDTRNGIGGSAGATRFAAGDDRAIMIRGVAGVPANAQSVVVNITAVEPSGSGYVTAYPSGTSLPDASNLNLIRGQDRPNLSVVKIGADGAIRLSVSETSTHLLVDVQGYYAPAVNGARRTVAVDPVRIFDTRNGIGTSGGRMGPGETRTVQVAGPSGVGGIPTNATAVYVNITSVEASAWGWLAVWPTGNSRPDVSNVNWPGGTNVPNMAIVALGANGTLQLYNDPAVSGSTSTHVLIDVMGYVV